MKTKMMMMMMLVTVAAAVQEEAAALFARRLVSQGTWGVLATIKGSNPFGYVTSYADAGTGNPYFYLSPALDPAGRNAIKDPAACFTLSQISVDGCNGADPQSPFCAKISLIGQLVMLGRKTKEAKMAQKALFASHPQLAEFPKRNGTFAVFKLDVQTVFLVNKPATAVALTAEDYLKLE